MRKSSQTGLSFIHVLVNTLLLVNTVLYCTGALLMWPLAGATLYSSILYGARALEAFIEWMEGRCWGVAFQKGRGGGGRSGEMQNKVGFISFVFPLREHKRTTAGLRKDSIQPKQKWRTNKQVRWGWTQRALIPIVCQLQ